MHSEDDLTVGDIARACGVSPDTVRHYERKGAIPAASRRANRYRSYPRAAVVRVQVVRRALALGFTIDELARLFKQRAHGKPPCREVRALAERKLAELDARIAEMSALRETLAATIRDWDTRLEQTGEGEPAHLLESLTRNHERSHS
jgi:DNA-binding transcriptional MerR regulator